MMPQVIYSAFMELKLNQIIIRDFVFRFRNMVTFADRKIIVARMDKQFEDQLRMRKEMNVLNHRAVGMKQNLQLMQKVTFFKCCKNDLSPLGLSRIQRVSR